LAPAADQRVNGVAFVEPRERFRTPWPIDRQRDDVEIPRRHDRTQIAAIEQNGFRKGR
jgi:hypothetical protein